MTKDKPSPKFVLNKLQQKFKHIVVEENDLTFDAPTPAIEQPHLVEVWVGSNDPTKFTGKCCVTYQRTNIHSVFGNLMKTRLIEQTLDAKGIVEQLNAECGIELDYRDFTHEEDGGICFLVAKPESFEYEGRAAVGVITSGEQIQLDHLVIDDSAASKKSDAHIYSYPMSFAGLASLANVVSSQPEMLATVASALEMESGDPWKVTKKANPYNLYGATIVRNGQSYVDRPEEFVLQIELNDAHCTNMQGVLSLYYSLAID